MVVNIINKHANSNVLLFPWQVTNPQNSLTLSLRNFALCNGEFHSDIEGVIINSSRLKMR